MAARAFLIILLFSTSAGPDDGFVSLTGDDPASSFDSIQLGGESVAFVDGEIRFTGSPRGYLATKTVYGDFILWFEWKFDVPDGADPVAFEGNSGVLLRIKPPHKVWPVCLESQITPDDAGSLFAIDSTFDGETNLEAQRLASRPIGQWNEAEIEMIGKQAVSRLNGHEVARGRFEGPAGPIGFQSQGGAIRFRKVRIKTLPKS